ncbi:hypothetical protein [Rugamonas sp. DEMB1]|uniref:hypothetical protein n=1 Tax=Rugamonas sp. DEMB1 TaxID=3039386 RepID=UPI00391984D1
MTKFIAMPPPMVPAPITAACLMARVGVSDGTSGTLLATRSAKKAWRSAFDSVVCIRPRKHSRSNLTPSSNFIVTAAATVSTHLSGAGKGPDMALTVLRENCRKASWLG